MYFAPISLATKYNYLDDKFQAAYKWLAETDLNNTPAGSYPICEGVTANVQEYTTFPASEGSFETHDKFFDIQYVISGKEQFGVCKRDGLVLKEDHPENDLKFYEEPAMSGTVLLLPGDMIVVAPEDAHKPRHFIKKAAQRPAAPLASRSLSAKLLLRSRSDLTFCIHRFCNRNYGKVVISS